MNSLGLSLMAEGSKVFAGFFSLTGRFSGVVGVESSNPRIKIFFHILAVFHLLLVKDEEANRGSEIPAIHGIDIGFMGGPISHAGISTSHRPLTTED
ncbi:hypothetical protein SUGI_0036590 [Cryptomeria japonica]|nr:hypothetical protein SUGI_0036590 [Cryptomeria japonica]